MKTPSEGHASTSAVNHLETHDNDPYADWSDERRMSEFAHTGDPKYLTVELAQRMHISPEAMSGVSGVTDEAMAFSFRSEASLKEKEMREADAILAQHGADSESIKDLTLVEQIKKLLALAGVRQESVHNSQNERVRQVSFERLYDLVMQNEGSVYALLDSLRHSEPEGLRDLAVLEDLYKAVHRDFVVLQHTPGDELTDAEKERGHHSAQTLNEFVNGSLAFIQGKFVPETKYLFAERARAFSFLVGDLTEEGDLVQYQPFKITKGAYAAFSEDKNRLYIAESADVPEIEDMLQSAPPITRTEVGNFFARHYHEVAPEEFWDARELILDAGTPVDELFSQYNIEDKELVYDYIAMLQSPSRRVIEEDFGIHLQDLSLREQFHFLNYLKHTSVETADIMKEFVQKFGVDGMKTFLATAYDPDLGEKVLTFSTLTDEEIVRDVFRSYASSLSGSEKFADTLAESAEGSKEVVQFASEFREAFIRRAAHLFFAAEQMSTYWYDKQTSDHAESMEDLSEAFRGLALLAEVLGSIHGDAFASVQNEVSEKGRAEYVLTDSAGQEYVLNIFVRPHTEEVKRRVRVDGKPTDERVVQVLQARINIELSLDGLPEDSPLRQAFLSSTEYLQEQKSVQTSVIRFGIDLDNAYDPPRLSFDMGRNAFAGSQQKRTGDVLGRILSEIAPHGHHLIEGFDLRFSEPAQFAKVARAFGNTFATKAR